MQVVHMSESFPGSTVSGQETDKEVEHILLVKMFLSGTEGLPNPPINSTLVILHVTFGFAYVSCIDQRKGEGEGEHMQ